MFFLFSSALLKLIVKKMRKVKSTLNININYQIFKTYAYSFKKMKINIIIYRHLNENLQCYCTQFLLLSWTK